MGARTGSGVLNPTARSFLPRSLSGGSDVFLTPAPSLVSASTLLDLTAAQVRFPTPSISTMAWSGNPDQGANGSTTKHVGNCKTYKRCIRADLAL